MLRDIETSLTLLDGLAADKAEAWERFVRLYFRPMADFAEWQGRRWGLDASECEDAVQRVFVAIARHTRTYDRSRGSFRNWLMLLVKSQVADLARAARARELREQRGAERLEDIRAEAVTDDESESVRKALFARALTQALERSEPRIREAFRRYALCGESAAKVAAELGLTANNLYQIRRRILDRVAEAMEMIPDV